MSTRFVCSPGSDARSYSWKAGRPPRSSRPGRGKLQPPDPRQSASFHCPSRIAKLPLIDWLIKLVRNRSVVLAQQRGEKTHAVLAGIRRQGDSQQIREGSQKIELADQLIGDAAGFHLARPADQKRHAVSAFVEICLVAAIDMAGVVTGGEKLVYFRGRRATVVRGEDDERVVGETVPIERVEDVSHVTVDLQNEIGVGIDTALALEFGQRHDGRMGRGQRDVSKEGVARLRVGSPLGDVFDRTAGNSRLHVDRLKILAGRSGAVESLSLAGNLRRQATVDPYVGEHIE